SSTRHPALSPTVPSAARRPPSCGAACSYNRGAAAHARFRRAARSASEPNPRARARFPSVSTVSCRYRPLPAAPWSCACRRARPPGNAAPLRTAAPRSPRPRTPHRRVPARRPFHYSNPLRRLSASGLPLRPPHDNVAAVRSGHRALHHQHVVLGVHFHHLKVAHGDPRVAHVAGHPHPRHHARRETGSADRTRCAMEHRPVRAFAAAEVMALHQAGETTALADADHVHLVLGFELVHQHPVAGLEIVVAGRERKLAQEFASFRAGLLEMTRGGLVNPLRLDELGQAELHRVVPIRAGRLALHHRARTRLEQGDRHSLSVGPEHLRHSDFLTKNSWTHYKFLAGTDLKTHPVAASPERALPARPAGAIFQTP